MPLQGGEPAMRAAGGLRARARGPGTRAGAQLGRILGLSATAGLEAELYLRQRVAGPLQAFGRALLHACGQGREAPGYNDFYRGILPAAPLASFAVFNAELILAPASLALPLWESVIFRRLELSAFGDLLWGEAAGLSFGHRPFPGSRACRGRPAFGGSCRCGPCCPPATTWRRAGRSFR